jgi:hypothetical protein
MRDPVLERLRLGLVGAHGQFVEAGFGDDGHLLETTKGVNPIYPPLVTGQRADSYRRVEQPQRPAHVRRDEPRVGPNGHDADALGEIQGGVGEVGSPSELVICCVEVGSRRQIIAHTGAPEKPTGGGGLRDTIERAPAPRPPSARPQSAPQSHPIPKRAHCTTAAPPARIWKPTGGGGYETLLGRSGASPHGPLQSAISPPLSPTPHHPDSAPGCATAAPR